MLIQTGKLKDPSQAFFSKSKPQHKTKHQNNYNSSPKFQKPHRGPPSTSQNNTKYSGPPRYQNTSNQFVSNWNTVNPSQNISCAYCHKKGHTIDVCRNRIALEAWKASKGIQTRLQSHNHSLTASTSAFVAPSSISLQWILDSGASYHMTGHRENLTTYQSDINSEEEISFGSGSQPKVKGSGDVTLKDGSIKDVFYVLGLLPNLLSV